MIILLILLFFNLFHLDDGHDLECKCGLENIEPKIVNGKEVKAHAFGWIAAFFFQNIFFCAGSLINTRYIVTAGHCLNGLNKNLHIKLAVDVYDIFKLNEAKVYYMDKYLVYPFPKDDNESSNHDIQLYHDIGLVRLEKTVTFNKQLRPICLPFSTMLSPFKNLKVMGWGRIGDGMKKSYRLLITQVIERDLEKCKKLLGKKRVSDANICAGDEKYDSCEYDSGGPLFHRYRGQVFLVGIVSWGITCANPVYPSVYTRVSSYLDWIYENTKDAQFCKH